MEDPQHHICVIASAAHEKYSLHCWKVQNIEATLNKESMKGAFYFSKLRFKWKDHFPIP